MRIEDGRLLVALIQEGSQEGFSLPKGHVESGETPEQAAVREVAEETGVHALQALGALGSRERLNFTKQAWNVIHYFVFRAAPDVRGDASWFPLDALPAMFWPDQRDLLITHRRELERMAMKQAVRVQFTARAAAYARSPTHRSDRDLSLLVARLRPRRSDRVLDIATGSGFTAMAMRQFADFVVGVDLTRRMLDEARKGARGQHIQWVEGDAEALPFAPETFSIAVVRRAPHHFADPGQALTEMLRVVIPRGQIGIIDQVPPGDADGRELMERLEVLRDPSHVRALPAFEWLQIVAAAGARVGFSRVLERPTTIAEWLELAGADSQRVGEFTAVLDRASPAVRAQIGDLGGEPRRFVKRWIVLVARKL